MGDYARRYLDLVQDYHTIWWKLFNAANLNRWGNVLSLIELLLYPNVKWDSRESLSTLKLIKSDRCSPTQ